MTDTIIDLSKPTGYFEVSVWHYSDDPATRSTPDRGLGRLTVGEPDSEEQGARASLRTSSLSAAITPVKDGEIITNEGTPFNGSIVHWDCGERHKPRVAHYPLT